MKATFVDKTRTSGGRLVLRGVLAKTGAWLVFEEISKDGEIRSISTPITEVPALIAGLNEASRWWRNRGGERKPMEGG